MCCYHGVGNSINQSIIGKGGKRYTAHRFPPKDFQRLMLWLVFCHGAKVSCDS